MLGRLGQLVFQTVRSYLINEAHSSDIMRNLSVWYGTITITRLFFSKYLYSVGVTNVSPTNYMILTKIFIDKRKTGVKCI